MKKEDKDKTVEKSTEETKTESTKEKNNNIWKYVLGIIIIIIIILLLLNACCGGKKSYKVKIHVGDKVVEVETDKNGRFDLSSFDVDGGDVSFLVDDEGNIVDPDDELDPDRHYTLHIIHEGKERVKVTFVNGSDKKTYEFEKGSSLVFPKNPTKSGEVFIGWKNEKTNAYAVKYETVNEDMTLIAQFGKTEKKEGKCTLNCDTDEDGKADTNVDTDGDGKPDLNIDKDGDGKPELNIDKDGDGKPDVNIDTDNDGKPDVNVDTDGDGIPDVNIDSDNDGKPDKNIDKDGDGKCDKKCDVPTDPASTKGDEVTPLDEKGIVNETIICKYREYWQKQGKVGIGTFNHPDYKAEVIESVVNGEKRDNATITVLFSFEKYSVIGIDYNIKDELDNLKDVSGYVKVLRYDQTGNPIIMKITIDINFKRDCEETTTTTTKPTTTTTTKASDTKYTCPSGYTLEGTKCTKTTVDTKEATPLYKCTNLNGYTLKGSKCVKTSTDTKNATKSGYTCESGYTLTQDNKCTKKVDYTCPSGYDLTPDGMCSKLTNATFDAANQPYCANNGYYNGTKCVNVKPKQCPTGTEPIPGSTQCTKIVEAKPKYTCPSDYKLDGTKCTKTITDEKDATKTGYECPKGYKLEGTKCTKTTVDTKNATKK